MYSLIVVLISIALFAFFLYAGMNYLSVDKLMEIEQQETTTNSIIQLSVAFQSYEQENDAPLPALNWEASISPDYLFMPPNPSDNLRWTYGTDGSGYWFCATGDTTSENDFNALSRIKNKFSQQAYFLDEDCGSKSNMANPASYPAKMSATYWIRY